MVHIFWEGRKILQNLHRKFDWLYRTNLHWRFGIFVTLSEYMNFTTWPSLVSKNHQEILELNTMVDLITGRTFSIEAVIGSRSSYKKSCSFLAKKYFLQSIWFLEFAQKRKIIKCWFCVVKVLKKLTLVVTETFQIQFYNST